MKEELVWAKGAIEAYEKFKTLKALNNKRSHAGSNNAANKRRAVFGDITNTVVGIKV
jgi:hypothetical protein